jgi:hypothetical protein
MTRALAGCAPCELREGARCVETKKAPGTRLRARGLGEARCYFAGSTTGAT